MHCSTLALLLVVILAAFLAYRRGIYTADGAAAGVAVYAAASLAGTVWAVLTALYVVASILLSGYGAEVKASRLGRLQGRAYHTWRHLAGRLGWGMVLVILVQLQHTDVLDYAFVGVIATALADVAATELGTLSAQPPRRLSDGVATSYGAPGAVSQIGLVAAAAGSWLAGFIVALRARALWNDALLWLPMAALAGGFIGTLSDSLLGAVAQSRYYCEHCRMISRSATHWCGLNASHTGGLRWVTGELVGLVGSLVGGSVTVLIMLLASNI